MAWIAIGLSLATVVLIIGSFFFVNKYMTTKKPSLRVTVASLGSLPTTLVLMVLSAIMLKAHVFPAKDGTWMMAIAMIWCIIGIVQTLRILVKPDPLIKTIRDTASNQ